MTECPKVHFVTLRFIYVSGLSSRRLSQRKNLKLVKPRPLKKKSGKRLDDLFYSLLTAQFYFPNDFEYLSNIKLN